MTVLLLEAVTKARRSRYIRRVKNAQRAIGRLEDSAVRNMRRDLNAARLGLMNAIGTATPFGEWRAQNVMQAVNQALLQFRDQATRNLQGNLNSAWDLGVSRASSFARSLDVAVPSVQFGISREQLDMAQGFSVDLIQEETDAIRKAVAVEVRLSAAGGLSRSQLTDRVRKKITSPLRFGTTRKRTETIVRTELNRMHNAAGQASREQLASENVKVSKQWLTSSDPRVREEHRKMHGVTVPVDEPFPYPGLPKASWPMYPLDPVLPAGDAINCRCTVVEVFDVIEDEAESIAQEVAADPKVTPKVTPPASTIGEPLKFPGVSKKNVAGIALAASRTLGKYGVTVDKVIPALRRGKHYGMATWTPGDGKSGIQVRSSFAKNPMKFQARDRARWKASNADAVESSENFIGFMQKKAKTGSVVGAEKAIAEAKDRLRTLKASTRWTVGTDAADPLRGVVAHEAGHIVYFKKGLKAKWAEAVKDIPRWDRAAVSEYSLTNPSELFAEAIAAEDQGIAIPKSISDALRKVGV